MVKDFLKAYLEMDILGTVIACPYWMNKISGGKVVLRGFGNGKGSAKEIKNELSKRISRISSGYTSEDIIKFAKRERIGIDCSGFVYRFLEMLIKSRYKQVSSTINDIFPDGANRTNARSLTSLKYCKKIEKAKEIQIGDMIRLSGGRHIAVYAHSSNISKNNRGVHQGIIEITDSDQDLGMQHWFERTRSGALFNKKFLREKGDGVFRLKIFC